MHGRRWRTFRDYLNRIEQLANFLVETVHPACGHWTLIKAGVLAAALNENIRRATRTYEETVALVEAASAQVSEAEI